MSTINVKKILESNLPLTDDDFTMSFTEEGNLYYTKNDGSQLKVTDIKTGYVNLVDLQTHNPAIENKIYLTKEAKLYVFSGGIYVEISGGSGSGSIDGIKQITRLNTIAPHTTTIPINFTSKFGGLPLEVLKADAGSQGIVEVLCDFNNADETDFEANKYVEFDGTAHLKTDYKFPVKFMSNGIYEFDFAELDQFKETLNVSVLVDSQGHAILDNGSLAINSNLSTKATISKTEGKWYWEVKKVGGSDFQFYGICGNGIAETMHSESASGLYTTSEVGNARYIHKGDEATSISSTKGLVNGDVLGIALDLTTDTIEYYINGVKNTEQPVGFKPSDLGVDIYPVITSWQKTNIKNAIINLGTTVFDYPVPDGFLPYNFVQKDVI